MAQSICHYMLLIQGHGIILLVEWSFSFIRNMTGGGTLMHLLQPKGNQSTYNEIHHATVYIMITLNQREFQIICFL
jgi:hypothetical protein